MTDPAEPWEPLIQQLPEPWPAIARDQIRIESAQPYIPGRGLLQLIEPTRTPPDWRDPLENLKAAIGRAYHQLTDTHGSGHDGRQGSSEPDASDQADREGTAGPRG